MKIKKRHLFLLLIVGVVGYFKIAYHDITYHYRLTVEIDTPEGVKSGSNIIDIHRNVWPEWISHMGSDGKSIAEGEAIFINLGNNKNAVMLLANGHYAQKGRIREWPLRAFFSTKPVGTGSSKLENKFTEMIGEKRELTGTLIPTLVTFTDLTNPYSVNVIYAVEKNDSKKSPPIILNKMEEILGKGYRLRSVTLEITDDTFSPKLEDHISWINNDVDRKEVFYEITSHPPKGKRFHLRRILIRDGLF